MPEAAQPQVASPPEKPRVVREVWQSQPVPAVAFLCFLSLAKQRKEVPSAGMRRKGEQDVNGEGYLKVSFSLIAATKILISVVSKKFHVFKIL